MRVYRAMASGVGLYILDGFSITIMIIGATNIVEAIDIANDADMGTIDPEDVWELTDLSTSLTEAGVIEQF